MPQTILCKDSITTIKGIAIILVIISHIGQFGYGIRMFVPLGGIGVAVFLILSGYGSMESIYSNGLKVFWKNRILRIVIPNISLSPLALLPLCILFSYRENYHIGTFAGISITFLVISFLLFTYGHVGNGVRKFFNYQGSNSLAILVFTRIFTVITKMDVLNFCFDQTVICFAVCALTFVVAGCLCCAWLLDKFHLSQFFF